MTLERADPEELFAALGYPPEILPDRRFLAMSGWLTLVMTLLTAVYLITVRRHFRKSSAR